MRLAVTAGKFPVQPKGAPAVYRPAPVAKQPRPPAPPVYRPVTSRIAQQSPASGAPPVYRPLASQPTRTGTAPPVYRPAPAVVARKTPASGPPPVYRPQAGNPIQNRTAPLPFRPAGTATFLPPAFLQAKLNAIGKFKVCGILAATSDTWAGFLTDEGIEDRFYTGDEAALKLIHEATRAASEAHKKSKGATTGRELLKLHTELVAKANDLSVSPGGSHWQALVDAALDEIAPQPSGMFIKKNATDAAATVWPVALLGAAPEAFWKEVLREAKPKPVVTAPPALHPDVVATLAHAEQRFSAWKTGAEGNRGGWIGSDLHGAQPADYEGAGPALLARLEVALPHGGWKYKKSVSSAEGASLHKYGGAAKGQDFIYHL
jgi:hypothetical protein